MMFDNAVEKVQDYLDVIFLVSKLMKMLRMEGPIDLPEPTHYASIEEAHRLIAVVGLPNVVAAYFLAWLAGDASADAIASAIITF